MVCSARLWADRPEQLGGTSGGSGEMRGGPGGCRMETAVAAMWGPAASRSWVGEPLTGGPAWAAPRAGWIRSRKLRLIPSRPAVCRARGNQKQLKIPDFPFHLAEGWGKHKGGGGQATGRSSTFSHCPAQDASAPAALVPGGHWPSPSIPTYFGVSTRQGPVAQALGTCLLLTVQPVASWHVGPHLRPTTNLNFPGPSIAKRTHCRGPLAASPLRKRALQKAVNLRRRAGQGTGEREALGGVWLLQKGDSVCALTGTAPSCHQVTRPRVMETLTPLLTSALQIATGN